jgi:hypothetical protein
MQCRNSLWKTFGIGGWSLEGAPALSRALHRFQDLRLGREAVPLQNSDPESFSASSKAEFKIMQLRSFTQELNFKQL